MIIAFFGHSHFSRANEYEAKVLDFLEKEVGDRSADMYLGGYGEFDSFAYRCCAKYKESHPLVSLVFVTPYISSVRVTEKYDQVLYPGLECTPPQYAISHRNRWMIESADCVVVYITHRFGGAYEAYKHAIRKKKRVYNIFDRVP